MKLNERCAEEKVGNFTALGVAMKAVKKCKVSDLAVFKDIMCTLRSLRRSSKLLCAVLSFHLDCKR